MSNTFLTPMDQPGYIVAWKLKYDFKTGRYDEEMTYGEAKKRAEELSAEKPEMAFWPEKKREVGGANRFYNPEAH